MSKTKLKEIDVITVCYNSLEPLKLTIENLQKLQTQIILNWIVVDGNSSDGSISAVKNSSITNITHIVEEDNGIYHAMNKGLMHITSDFFILLNAGDIFLETNLFLYKDKVNCFQSAWHDIAREHASNKNNYILPFLGIMPNHQGMIFPNNYKNIPYRLDLKICADLQMKMYAYKNHQIVLRSEFAVSSLQGGISGSKISFNQYLQRIIDNFHAVKSYSLVFALSSSLFQGIFMLRRIRF
jgi:glycosyltransferase involved in cell wall biosynthesis